MLASSAIIREVSKEIRKYGLSLVVDPVMAAEAGGDLLRKEALSVLIEELLPICKVVTPNAMEAEALSGVPVKNPEDAKIAARIIADLGAAAVIITGGHIDATDLLYEANSDTFTRIPGTFVKGGTHGSGCTYSAALTAFLACGKSLEIAAVESKKFVVQAILKSRPAGRGVNPVNPLGAILEEKERYLVLKNLNEAVSMLEKSPDFSKLIPEVGSNIGMAIPGAYCPEDIAAVEGRIVKYRERAFPVGCVGFGKGRHVGSVILSALRYDPEMRAAISLKYSERNLSICREAGLRISSFDRTEEPEATKIKETEATSIKEPDAINTNESDDITTLSRGTAEAIKKLGGVPGVIYDKGASGKEPMIRLLGTNAVEVARLAVELAEKL
jgi:hydroxymethylpyrimidine/phosphomethylpyrimidine kinase